MRQRHYAWLRCIVLCIGFSAFSACSAASASQVASPTTTATSATTTSSPSVTPTATGELCSGLDPFLQAVQNGALQGVGFNFSIPMHVLIKGTFSHYTATPAPTISGAGYMLAPTNDPVMAQLTRTPSSVTVTMQDTTTQHSTTYSVTTCTTNLPNQLTLTGTMPQAFTLTLLNMQ